jgi:cation diffusion facilitator CzcD-associated flavoprotein CzcO
MNTNSIKVHIIGGGISGLVAAQVLENIGLLACYYRC